MNKLAVFFVLASIVALSWAFPKEERQKHSPCSQTAQAALKLYGLDASMCGPSSKRFETDFGRLLRRRELEYELSRPRYARGGFNACCSPDCDWLLNYLEIDSTVVKCIDRK